MKTTSDCSRKLALKLRKTTIIKMSRVEQTKSLACPPASRTCHSFCNCF